MTLFTPKARARCEAAPSTVSTAWAREQSQRKFSSVVLLARLRTREPDLLLDLAAVLNLPIDRGTGHDESQARFRCASIAKVCAQRSGSQLFCRHPEVGLSKMKDRLPKPPGFQSFGRRGQSRRAKGRRSRHRRAFPKVFRHVAIAQLRDDQFAKDESDETISSRASRAARTSLPGRAKQRSQRRLVERIETIEVPAAKRREFRAANRTPGISRSKGAWPLRVMHPTGAP